MNKEIKQAKTKVNEKMCILEKGQKSGKRMLDKKKQGMTLEEFRKWGCKCTG